MLLYNSENVDKRPCAPPPSSKNTSGSSTPSTAIRVLSPEWLNHHWVKTEMSGGLPMARSSFNRHRDAILDMFGIIIDCDKKDGYRYHIGNAEVLTERQIHLSIKVKRNLKN